MDIVVISERDFKRLSSFIYQEVGIKLPAAKKIMLQSRLQRRLRELKMSNFTEYTDYVLSPEGMEEELVNMIDVVSTNKTDFFRESAHFDFLTNTLLPSIYSHGNKFVNIWSSACSSGEEPYTMAIVLAEFAAKNPGFDFSILATDISTIMLKKAVSAIYAEERIAPVSNMLRQKYFLRSKDRTNLQVRVVPEIRSKVTFKRINLMDDTYDVPAKFDIIFCRNVLIYFDRVTQESVINKLCTKLKSGGHFFLGHSESAFNMNVPIKPVKPTIFTRI